jgi:hypothetical protein
MLDADERPAVDDAARAIALPRQFWDGQKRLGLAVAASLGLDRPAWDIYMFFAPDATWGAGGPPRPLKVLAQAGGVVVASPGTLPPAADQAALPPRLAGRAIVVGEQHDLPALLARVAASVVATR